MKRALVVKALTEQIILIRTDGGELLSLSVPCRSISAGSLLVVDTDGTGCAIMSVNGKDCRSVCHRTNHAMVIEQRGDASVDVPVADERKRQDVI